MGGSGKWNVFTVVTNGEGPNVFVVSIFNSHNCRPTFVGKSECQASKVSRTNTAHRTKLLQPPSNISKFCVGGGEWGGGASAILK